MLVCLNLRKQSAIYSAPGGAVWSEPIQQLQRFGLNRGNCWVQPSRWFWIWIAEWVCSQPIPVRPDSKRTRLGREPEPEPGPAPPPPPPAAARAAWFPPNRARKLQVPKGHTLCSQFSLFKHYELPSHGQCGTKCL